MKTYTLDNIVRAALSERGYTMHWYLQFLQFGIDSFRELNFDVLKNVKSVRLPVGSYQAVTLPCDFVDFVRVGNELGQYIYPHGEKQDSFNRLNKFDANGGKIPYGDIESENGFVPNDWQGFWGTTYVNSYGEHTGRIFNNFSGFRDSFVVLRERNEIQLDVSYAGKEIVLDYITDGVSTDATTAVHPYAYDTIKNYIFWRMKENARQYNLQERQLAKEAYYNSLRTLRARMFSIDVNDIKRSLARGYNAAIKN